MCVCVCVYAIYDIYIYTHTHIHTHKYMCSGFGIHHPRLASHFTYENIDTCTHTYIHTHTCTGGSDIHALPVVNEFTYEKGKFELQDMREVLEIAREGIAEGNRDKIQTAISMLEAPGVCIYACMYVCMYSCVYVCVCVCVCVLDMAIEGIAEGNRDKIQMYVYICLRHLGYVFKHVCMYVCMYSCVHVCMYVCVCVFWTWP